MQGMYKIIGLSAALLALNFQLTACQNSSTDVSVATTGTLTLNNGKDIRQYATGTALDIPITLSGASNTDPVPVSITSNIASISPNTCYLTGSGNGSTCHVMVRGMSEGQDVIKASAPAYADDALIGITVGNAAQATTPNYGSVQIGVYPSAHQPSTSNFTTTAKLGQIVRLQTSLTGFDTPLDGVPILLDATGGASFVGNPQCSVDSTKDQNHYCLYELRLPNTAPKNNTVTVTATVVGNPASFQAWNSPTVTITTQDKAVPGTIVLQKRDTSVPVGMSSPMWAVLQDSSGVGATAVTLSTDNANIQLNPEITATQGDYRQKSCVLSSSNPVCGFGVLGVKQGNAKVSALTSPADYTIASLPFSITKALGSARTIKFVNDSNKPVWVGITGGTSNSYETEEMVSTVNPASNGPNKMCGPSNPAGACPTGSTCRQGGAVPESKTTYFCYWDQAVPSNGYKIAAGTGSGSTSISVSDSSYDPVADITWSGNFFPREGCTTNANGDLKCEIADCGGPGTGAACAPGTGGSPAVATLPEVTLQPHSTDYYDISVIAGANIVTSFGPDAAASTASDPVPAANDYLCGTAGDRSAQGNLAASDWDMATHVQDTVITGATTPYSQTAQTGSTLSSAYFHLVSTLATRESPGCSTDTECKTAGYVCGYDINAVNGSSPDYQTSCGNHLAWMSASEIWALHTQADNAAPFKFSGSYTDAAGATINYYQLFTCTAPTVSGYSTPITDAARTCGCTNWGDSSFQVAGDAAFASQVAKPSQNCTANNTVNSSHEWTTYVLPTIAWLKKSCPTCYTYPFDDMSSTFQCTNQKSSSSGKNTTPYVITFSGNIAGQ